MNSFATRQLRQLLHNQYDHINQILIITIRYSIRAFIYIPYIHNYLIIGYNERRRTKAILS